MNQRDERGFALISTIVVSALLAALLTAYFVLTNMERATTLSSMSGNRGFHVAEAGLNLRAERIRQTFLGYNRPEGSPPEEVKGQLPCLADPGAGDFRCLTYSFDGRNAVTYVREAPDNPTSIVVPPGELYQHLNAQAYRYASRSVAIGADGRPEAILNMEFESRLVPLFQFAAFYDKDLEILPGNSMTLEGPVYCNGSMYLGAEGELIARGQLAATGSVFHGRKDYDGCQPGSVLVYNPVNPLALPACGPGRRKLQQEEEVYWNGMIRTGIEPVTVPEPEALDPNPGRIYWDRADLRIVVNLNGSEPTVEVRNREGAIDPMTTSILAGCDSAAGYSMTFHNRREGKDIQMLEVDIPALLECVQQHPLLMDGKLLDDTSDGGLVWYMGVDGPDSNGINPYGIRIKEGRELTAGDTAPEINGLTIVTNQAVYVQGDYNSVGKKPAAILADSLNILSADWQDTDVTYGISAPERAASDTVIYAAFLAGTDTTGGTEEIPLPGTGAGSYNGGLENFPRFHENWGGARLTYRGSFVSLNSPQHVNGPWGLGDLYVPPIRDWSFDTDFNDAANLPPLSPRFVYLKQNLFVREFEL